MSLLQVEGVTHSFGDKTVFRNVSFRLLAGEHVGLVGTNGAGKSTLLKILTGDLLPDEGRVEWMSGLQLGHLEQHIDLKAGETVRDYLRGAFAELFAMESEMLLVTERMAAANESELDSLLQRFSNLQEALDGSDFYLVDAKVEEVAAGLGLTEIGLEKEVDQLSGGQRTKLLLAKLLLQKPQVLLLDEPTNYLDTEHITWLTGYLQSYPNAFLLISHNTTFMNAVVGVIYHLEHKTFNRYIGNYKQFLETYEMRKTQLLQAYNQQQREIQKLETYIQKNKVRTSTAKQAKSREKRLAKIERIDKPTGHPRPLFKFPVTEHPTSVVMEARNLLVGYDEPLLPPLDLKLKRGAKVALVGYNGIGKSTSLKTILGLLPALGGRMSFGERVLPAYFAQEDDSTAEHTAMEEVWRDFPKLTIKEVRGALARCGLKTEHISQPMKTLSGGEQSKVRLCKLILQGGNWLVLDEPTNHLDVLAKEALKEALIAYPGTVLLVSHDPSFYEGWATDVWNVEAWAQEPQNKRAIR
ncbi:MAG: ABC-F family ATP-binding cassette domain-containing protein [Tumebacillaceae bacterium]